MILDWNDFFEQAPSELMSKFSEVKAVIIATPIQYSPTKHVIRVDVYHQGPISKKNISRFFTGLAEKLSGSVYRGHVYRSDKGEEVFFEGRLEPRISVSILPFESMIEKETTIAETDSTDSNEGVVT